jgi:hypothetical protein
MKKIVSCCFALCVFLLAALPGVESNSAGPAVHLR